MSSLEVRVCFSEGLPTMFKDEDSLKKRLKDYHYTLKNVQYIMKLTTAARMAVEKRGMTEAGEYYEMTNNQKDQIAALQKGEIVLSRYIDAQQLVSSH